MSNFFFKYFVLVIFLFDYILIANGQSQIFDVRQLGAKGDSKTLDTAFIQEAINRCNAAGGGVVHFLPGTYLCQPITLWNKVALQLDEGATLLATDTESDFAVSNKLNSYNAFISGTDLTGIQISGKGIIDGAGGRWWKPVIEGRNNNKNFKLPRPRMIALLHCKDIQISGVTLQNAPSFHLLATDCDNIAISGVSFVAPTNSPDTDGVDLTQCRHVRIAKCFSNIGGEGVVIQSSRPFSDHAYSSDDIAVSDCTFSHGRGFSIGSDAIGGIHGVIVKDCTFSGTEEGVHIKSAREKGGIIDGINCEGLTMTNVKSAIIITCYNQGFKENDSAQSVGEFTPSFRNIHFNDITADANHSAGLIAGLPESAINGVTFENVNISAPYGLKISNARGIQFKKTRITCKQGSPLITEANVETLGETNLLR
jgi:polygalacturonase